MNQIKKLFLTLRNIDLRSPTTYIWIGYWVLLFWVLYTNTFHEEYPDEFDNILGGYYILHGKLPFSGFFSHHGPVAYFLAAVISIFSGTSFVKFRIIYSILLFVGAIVSYRYIQQTFSEIKTRFYLVFLLVLAISGTYFWGHMFIADNLSAYFFIPAFVTFILRLIQDQKLHTKDVWIISIFSCLSLLSSLTYLYLVFFFYILVLFYYLKDRSVDIIESKDARSKIMELGYPFVILGTPFFVFLLYLLLTGSMMDYLYQSIIYNSKYYVYNYPSVNGVTTINPVRHIVIIATTFIQNYYDLLLQARNFNFNFPLNITFALGNTFFIFYLLLKRKFLLALFSFIFIMFSNSRTNPLESGEKDYQSAVYIVFSLFTTTYTLRLIYKDMVKERLHNFFYKIILAALFLILGIYFFYSVAFLYIKFQQKTFSKYMGLAPLIYDRNDFANIILASSDPTDFVWIGPLEFEELLYIDRKIASRHHILLPGMGKSEKLQKEMLADFQKTQPTVIWLNKSFSILGYRPVDYAKFFITYLDTNYTTIYDYSQNGEIYKSTLPITTRVDVEKYLYIRKDKIIQVINKLQNAGLLKKV